ncbi:hypothetical protein Avbf_09776, partial [Armadillidium vulgare]
QVTLFSKVYIFCLNNHAKPPLPLNLFAQLFVIEVQVVFLGDVPSDNYAANAIKYIKRKYKNPIFIAISDDVKRLKEILKNEKNIAHLKWIWQYSHSATIVYLRLDRTVFGRLILLVEKFFTQMLKPKFHSPTPLLFIKTPNLSNFVHINDTP